LTLTDTQVVIAGAGPTGLMLACELGLAGIDVLMLERLPEPRTVESRAGGLHIRTMETLDQRGLLDRFLERGLRRQGVHFSGLRLDVSDVATRHPYTLVIMQSKVERLLEECAAQAGAQLRRGAEVTTFTQDKTGVMVELADGSRVRADYLVGCDGGFRDRDQVISAEPADLPLHPALLVGAPRSQAGNTQPRWRSASGTRSTARSPPAPESPAPGRPRP
jgi:3-(3-hydroxy-phenyl)propionate hydroxylase